MTIQLKPEQEQVIGQAIRAGLMVEGVVLPATQKTLSPEQRAAAFEAWSANHRATPPLSDYAVSREAMYEGRDH
jgi:hypothetical protein